MQIYTIIGGCERLRQVQPDRGLEGRALRPGAAYRRGTKQRCSFSRKKLGGQSTTPILLCKTAFFPALLDAGKIAVRKIDECLEKGISFTQETTLSGARTERTIRRAKERGVHHPPVLHRPGHDGGKPGGALPTGWPRAATTSPGRTWSAASKAALRTCCGFSPTAMRPRFFDNDNGFVEVAEYRNGELIPRVPTPPRWLLELMERVE